MARNKTLESILADLNAEVGEQPNPSYNTGVVENRKRLIRRTQEFLWDRHDWDFLNISKDIQLQAGSRYYDHPSEIDVDRITSVYVKYAGDWVPVTSGISVSHYNTYDSDMDERVDPVLRWDHYYDTENDAEMIEVWPLPNSNFEAATKNGALRVTGIKQLSPLVEEGDKADIDDRLIVLYAAYEILSRDKSPDAQIKFNQAESLYQRLKGNTSGPDPDFTLGNISGETGNDYLSNDESRIRIRAVYGNKSGA